MADSLSAARARRSLARILLSAGVPWRTLRITRSEKKKVILLDIDECYEFFVPPAIDDLPILLRRKTLRRTISPVPPAKSSSAAGQ